MTLIFNCIIWLLATLKALHHFCIRLIVITPIACIGYAALAHPHKPIEIIYPMTEGGEATELDLYYLKLLKLGMDKSGYKYTLTVRPTLLSASIDSEFGLARNRFNLHWLTSSEQREQTLLPIRIPLFKGLIGWRVFLVKSHNLEMFAAVKNAKDLQPYLSGHGHNWPDVDIFKHNNLPVHTSNSWEGVFRMLQAERVDYFPRSIIQVWRDQQQFPDTDKQVESHLALHYPAAYYFFTNKQNPELAAALTRGLNIAIEDGSFDEIFMAHYGEYIKKAKLDSRTIIELENPYFHPIKNPAYWYNPLSHSEVHSTAEEN